MSGRGRGRGQSALRGRGRGVNRGGFGASRGGRGTSRGRGGTRGSRGVNGRGRVQSRGARGTRGRGRGSDIHRPDSSNSQRAESYTVDRTQKDDSLDISKDLKSFFVGTASFDQHYDAQTQDRTRYAAGMVVLEQNGVELSQNARVRALAASWARTDHDLADALLQRQDQYGLVEVLKALTLLDSSRRIREHEKKMKKKQIETGNKINSKLMGKFKSDIDNLQAIRPKFGSASGAVCKHIKKWVKRFTKNELEFYALHFPTEPWKRLADLCHFHPQKDFPGLPWFLPFCYGQPAPDGTIVASCRNLSAHDVNNLLREFPIPFSHVKQHKARLTDESKGRIAATDKLDQVLWNYEDLQCSEVDDILLDRLRSGDQVGLPYGKLMERLLTIKMIREDIQVQLYGRKNIRRNKKPTKAMFFKYLVPVAQQQLKTISLSLETPVVVIGDRSYSMDVAIRTSTIIASLLTALCGARLVFFAQDNMDAPFIPTNIKEVLKMALTITTAAYTVPAASLWPFYRRREVVKTFIVVTDEEENEGVNVKDEGIDGVEEYWFAPLFKKYRAEVCPDCRLVFVSFLRDQHERGDMMAALHKEGITDNVMQFKFDQVRPDLTKLDKLFGLLSAETDDFEVSVSKVSEDIHSQGMVEIFQRLGQKKDAVAYDVADLEIESDSECEEEDDEEDPQSEHPWPDAWYGTPEDIVWETPPTAPDVFENWEANENWS